MKVAYILLMMNVFTGMGYSIVAPIFPFLGKKDNIDETIIGFIISVFPFANMCITPFVPNLIKKIKRGKLLYFATFCEASCTFLFGFLGFYSSYKALIITAIILRIIHGMCSGIIFTLIYSITSSLSSKDEVQKDLGNLELGWCLGTFIGPICASFFYHLGGYPLPFIVLGISLYISVFLATIVASNKIESAEDTNSPEFAKYLTQSDILTLIEADIIGNIVYSFYTPCLTNYLVEEFGYSVSAASLFFLIPVITYVIPLQFLDLVTSKFGFFLVISSGLFILSIGCFLVSPVTLKVNDVLTTVCGLSINGFGSGPVFVPSFVLITKYIMKKNPNFDELTANDITGSLVNLTNGLGIFIGPVLGGYFTSHFNFSYCCFFVSIIVLIGFFWYVYFFYDNILNEIKNIKNIFSSPKLLLLEKEEEKKQPLSMNFSRGRKYSLPHQKNEGNISKSSLYSSLTQ